MQPPLPLPEHGSASLAFCRKPAEAREVQGIDNVSLTTIDVQSPQSVAEWAEEVARLTPHVDVRLFF